MQIEILEFVEGARKAKGVAVIIDVFRAFSVACYAFEAGASRIITTASVEMAKQHAASIDNAVLAGERSEKKIEGFDLGNSPTEIINADLKGKVLIHTTTAGTNGLANAINADFVMTGSIVNAAAVAKHIQRISPEYVSLVAMGYRGNTSADEDMLCARIISDYLRGTTTVHPDEINQLRNTSGQRFFNPLNIEFSPPSDFFLCTIPDRFDFSLKAISLQDGSIELFKTEL